MYTVSVCEKSDKGQTVGSNNTEDTSVHDSTTSDEKQQVTQKQIINRISALSCLAELDQLKAQPDDGKQLEFLKQKNCS